VSAAAPNTRLAPSLPYRRIALVLSGGGALGAYEIGVLRVLEAVRLVPSLVVGVSIGAVNAVAWLAAGYDAGPIERVWRSARGETLGVQWVSLVLRVTGAFLVVMATFQAVLRLVSSSAFFVQWVWHRPGIEIGQDSVMLDVLVWVMLALIGALMAIFARRVAGGLDQRPVSVDPARARLWLGRAMWIAVGFYLLMWLMPVPWPQTSSASLVILLAVAWAATTRGRLGRWLRGLALGLMPETRGRALWSGQARQRILERLVAEGDGSRLCGPGTALVVTALALDRGTVTHFASWPETDARFETRLGAELDEVLHVRDADEMIRAAVASSAIPGLFQPETIRGRDFIDAGGFSNQPLHVAIADGADALLVVLVSPSGLPDEAPLDDVVSLGNRLLELANWRDLQTELRNMPPEWSREGVPARVCVIEPPSRLPAAPLVFDPEQAGQLIALGERDAWAALERSGWLERAPERERAAAGLRPGAVPGA